MMDGPAGTITLIVTMQFTPEQEATFLETAANSVEWVHADEAGALLYTLSTSFERAHIRLG